jgi:hypothetical protein
MSLVLPHLLLPPKTMTVQMQSTILFSPRHQIRSNAGRLPVPSIGMLPQQLLPLLPLFLDHRCLLLLVLLLVTPTTILDTTRMVSTVRTTIMRATITVIVIQLDIVPPPKARMQLM